MRREKRTLPRRVNGQLRIEFGGDRLTSYAGLEVIQRHLRAFGFNDLLRWAFAGQQFVGDYGLVPMVRLFLTMILVGARRLRHVRFLSRDPMVLRTAGLSGLPDERTLSRWLGRFNAKSLRLSFP
jgi:hypothetical protein